MAALSVTFGKELSPQLAEIYWDALKPMAIEQVQEAAKSWIRHGKHFPKPADLGERSKEMQHSAPKQFDALPPRDGKWMGLVNAMFMQYLSTRRLAELFRGDLNLKARRAECINLAEFFENLDKEGDEEATEPQLKLRFDRAMARIADLSQDEAWLAIELERQRREDEANEAVRKRTREAA
jgi:hypothetical protein